MRCFYGLQNKHIPFYLYAVNILISGFIAKCTCVGVHTHTDTHTRVLLLTPSPRNVPSGRSWNWSAVCRLLPRIKVERLDAPHHIHCLLLKRDKKLSHWKTDVSTTWHIVKGQIVPVINNYTLHCTFNFSTHMYSTEYSFQKLMCCGAAGCTCGWMSLRMLDLIRGEFGSIDYHLLENQIKYRVKRKLKIQSKTHCACFPDPHPLHVSFLVVLAQIMNLSLWSSPPGCA